jgi:acyl-coenzyme A synthetase/AMP-(fatty) acid ligase
MSEAFNLVRYCLADPARRTPDKPALVLVDGEGKAETWTYAQLDEAVRRVAAGLLEAGLRPGDHVLLRCGNDAGFVLAFFGATGAGLVALPTSSQLTTGEVARLAADGEAVAVVLSDDHASEAEAFGAVRVITPADLATFAKGEALADYAATGADDPAYLVFTSGTTNRPKGVLHAHRVVRGRFPMQADWLGLTPDDVMLHAGAVNWTYTLGVGLFDTWTAGATAILYRGAKDPQVWPKLIGRFGATIFAAVPSVFRQILKYADRSELSLPSLRHCVTAGEALSPHLLDAWKDATGTWLYEAFGMTEISTYISTRPGTPVRPGSPGQPQRGRRIAILPLEEGTNPLPAGEVGLIAVHRSDPSLMLGYWKRPEEEAAVMRGAWFMGGDMAAMDADGFIWFHGRADDIMNAMGYRVSPLEVEAVLEAHPSIAEVAVAETRVRDDVSVITAFVVARPGITLDEGDLAALCTDRLAAYKRPRRWVTVDHIDRTPNGKVNRKALVRRAG